MKTMIKLTALAMITFVAVLSCSPEVSLTDRDYAEINKARSDAGLTNYSVGQYIPSLTGGTVSIADNATDSQRELTFQFPSGADFLKKSNDAIEAELKKFLSLFTFTAAANSPTVLPGTKGSDVGYTFVRRETTSGSSNTRVVIRVTSVPASTLVAKIDGTVYTVYGNKLDVNGDRIAGEAIYDDIYYDINTTTAGFSGSFTNSGTWVPPGGALSGGRYQNLTLTIAATPTFPIPSDATPRTIVSLGGGKLERFSTDGGVTYTEVNDIKRSILGSLAGSFKIQEYSDERNDWVDTTATISYNDGTNGGAVGDLTVSNFNATHLGVYRIKATGVSNLTSASYYGAPQKIAITANNLQNSASILNSFDRDVIINTASLSTNASTSISVQAANDNPVDTTQTRINSDHNGRNVTVELYFDSITVSALPSYLATLDLATFNKNFKLAYSQNASGGAVSLNSSNWTGTSNMHYIKVDNIAYSTSTVYNPAQPGQNLITLTLDPKYELTSTGRTVHFLIAPGFKYSSEAVYFGNPLGVNDKIDGVNRFQYYGSLGGF